MAKNIVKKFRRVAVEGPTIDGREITATQIQEMADSYDPKVYGARIWPEHFRGFFPGGAGDALGDIDELKAEKISDGSELDGKLALYATGRSLPKMKAMQKAGQKIFSSIEFFTKMPATGKAYFAGLAATDSPASLGTEIAAFGVGQGIGTTDSIETELDFEEEQENSGPSLFSRVKDLISKKSTSDTKNFSDIDESVMAIAESQQEILDNAESFNTTLTTIQESFTQLEEKYTALKTEHDELITKLSNDPNGTQRPPASGGDGQEELGF